MKNSMTTETIVCANSDESSLVTSLSWDHDQEETGEQLNYDPLGILSGESWRKVDAHIRKVQRAMRKGNPDKKGVDATQDGYRNILRGIYYHLKEGSKWHEIPVEYGEYTAIHRYFRSWLKAGLLDKVNHLIRKDEKKNRDMIHEKYKAEASKRPEPSVFQVATETINDLSYLLKGQIDEAPLDFDYLTDDEQLVAIASLEKILCDFTDALKRLENSICSEKLSAQSLGYPNPCNEVFRCIGYIGFYIEICLGKLASAYANLSDEEKSVVCSKLTSEWEHLNALLNELKEVEQMNIPNSEVLL